MAGTIILQSNGKYKLTFMKNKQRYYKTVSASDENEAKALLKDFVKFVDKVVDINPDICTFEEFCNSYFKNYAPNILSEECIYSYSKALINWVLPKIGHVTLSNCTTKLFIDFFKWLSNQVSPYTKNILAISSQERIYAMISSVFNCAVQWHILKENPVKNARPTTFKKKNKRATKTKKQRSLTLEESRRLVKALEDIDLKYKLIIHLAIIGGLRRSEILGLRWSDVDFKKGYIKTKHSSIYVPKKGYIVGNLKNEPSHRYLSIPKVTLMLLLDYKILSPNTDNNFIFINDKGRRKGLRLNPNSVTAWFKRFRKLIDLPDEVPLHGLRHTNATLLITKTKTNVKNVSKRLGHSNTGTTLNIYAEEFSSVDKTAGETLDKVLFNNKRSLKLHKKKKEEILKSPLS